MVCDLPRGLPETQLGKPDLLNDHGKTGHKIGPGHVVTCFNDLVTKIPVPTMMLSHRLSALLPGSFQILVMTINYIMIIIL